MREYPTHCHHSFTMWFFFFNSMQHLRHLQHTCEIFADQGAELISLIYVLERNLILLSTNKSTSELNISNITKFQI